MNITKVQLKRIIKEELLKEMEFSAADAEQYIVDKAEQYKSDPALNAAAIKRLLMDDFMDDLGHQLDIRDFQDLINQVSFGIRESWYPHDASEEDERMEPELGSFPPHYDTADMDDWQDGYEAGLRGSEIIRGDDGDPWKMGYDVGAKNSDLTHVRR